MMRTQTSATTINQPIDRDTATLVVEAIELLAEVKRIEDEVEKTKGGIIIPDTAKEKPMEGEIIAVGPGGRNEDIGIALTSVDPAVLARIAREEAHALGLHVATACRWQRGAHLPSLLGSGRCRDSPSPGERQGGRCSGLSAGGRACAACSCHTSSRPACGARRGAWRA